MHTHFTPSKKPFRWLFFVAFVLSSIPALTGQASPQKLILFDAPGGGLGGSQGTASVAINLQGTIVGTVTDSGWGTHGFVRTPRGQITNFDAPGADPLNGCTCPSAMNDLGVVTGSAVGTDTVSHGFLRYPNGAFATFDDPNEGTGAWQGITPLGINNFGVVTGYYTDANNVNHGFLRFPNGTFTTIDALGAGNGAYQGTTPYNINNLGAVAGIYVDPNGIGHGFLRSLDSKITAIDPPGSLGGLYGTGAALVNDAGEIAGYYFDASTDESIGYLRSPHGSFTTFEAPQAGTDWGSQEGTGVESVNVAGAVTGYVVDSLQERHSFVRTASGKITTFDIPGQLHAPYSWIGATGDGINAKGQIAGRWRDANAALHGCLLLPEE